VWGRVGSVGIGVGDKSSLDRTKTDSEVGTGRRRTGEGWMVVGDRHERSRGNYEDRARWESSAADWRGKGTDLGSSQVVVVGSSGELRGRRYDGRHQDGQRWIRRR